MGERDIRVGDAEREQALRLLGEHLGEGRLDVDEYGDRSARVATARTRGELLALFADLPAPHPRFAQVVPLPSPAAGPAARPRLDPRLAAGLVPAVGVLCVVLFFVAVKTPLIFLLVPAVALLVGRLGNRR
ncbi:DUF1707 SHOCT-like domain-containing protein [Saccharothrix algeriensis]|uniref:DUF1707 domain-containing protein n=1 Tax=Saccharothrix algeriensis TaxID=173560 RepID=A0A8T8HST5_9PSEU|nr:DUF1707 domain-containing protein [Saccharothrix algeriensis]MBM7812910.1 hypothetical protein [Saccharothrix algeriensis]QTR01556.1 DUF1707 domain-containing protein [Saccharothrix algeriensis]